MSILDLFIVQTAYALNSPQALSPDQSGGFTVSNNSNPVNFASQVINRVSGQALDLLALIAGIFAVLFLIWYGLQYILAGGSADKVKAARQGIINSVIGVVIVVAAYSIIRIAIAIGNTIDTAV